MLPHIVNDALHQSAGIRIRCLNEERDFAPPTGIFTECRHAAPNHLCFISQNINLLNREGSHPTLNPPPKTRSDEPVKKLITFASTLMGGSSKTCYSDRLEILPRIIMFTHRSPLPVSGSTPAPLPLRRSAWTRQVIMAWRCRSPRPFIDAPSHGIQR